MTFLLLVLFCAVKKQQYVAFSLYCQKKIGTFLAAVRLRSQVAMTKLKISEDNLKNEMKQKKKTPSKMKTTPKVNTT